MINLLNIYNKNTSIPKFMCRESIKIPNHKYKAFIVYANRPICDLWNLLTQSYYKTNWLCASIGPARKYQGRIQKFAKGAGPSPSLPLPFSLPFPHPPLPFQVGPLKPVRGSGERCQLPQWGPGRSPGRIWCTLKLPVSHWWQSF